MLNSITARQKGRCWSARREERRGEDGEQGEGGMEPFQHFKYKKVALFNTKKIKVLEKALFLMGCNH